MNVSSRQSNFRDINTAPLNGTTVEVRHVPFQTPTLAYWNRRARGWIADGNIANHLLNKVTGWRPIAPDGPKHRTR